MMKKTALVLVIFSFCIVLTAQSPTHVVFGRAASLSKFFSGKYEKELPLEWIDVNTTPQTWRLQKDMLICSGRPTGVMRSAKQYENFILHVEWMHMEKGGNSGMFVWSSANPPVGQNLPDGVEVQMLEKGWVELNSADGYTPPVAYVNGELFGVGGVKTVPDNPRGTRSKSIENRCNPRGEWNTYDVVCVDGVIRLSVNGRFVNGITKSTQKKGYICLESEGGEIHFRNLEIVELNPGVIAAGQAAPLFGEKTSVYKPLSLHPRNPHYFLFRDKPAILIGSTEHYGAVINLDFDYVTYLNELASFGLNVTRTFSGIYVEPQGAFAIAKNTLAPAPGRFICPWARSNEPGYRNGGNKFDLSRWNDEYFTRLKDFIKEAGKRNIVVELDLFSNFYDSIQWRLSPLYHACNINNTGNFEDWKEILSMKHPDVLKIQEDMARKIVSELKDFDNLYYEICNEPYFGDTIALREWQNNMTEVVADAEKDFENRHLISNNIQNNYRLVPEPRRHVSIYNFHYASPPKTVPANYHLNCAIGDNETGFRGLDDLPYRREAWDFILSGGALYDNLDYSFTADDEDGTFIFRKPQPGGGGKSLRFQLRTLADFINSVDFINMKPLDAADLRLVSEGKATVNGLGNDESAVLYVNSNATETVNTEIEISLKPGNWKLSWTGPVSESVNEKIVTDHKGGWLSLETGPYREDIALKIENVK
ncbi:MAG TPA: family 16 glycoside hydrolase [Bacteroidales bacterium]|jgi:hypothetical protein|nr:family 16 glycoside hydrolase [Bacteroidales bacterium]